MWKSYKGRYVMKKIFRRYISLICMISMVVAFLTGCGKTAFEGEWAYIHDDQTVALKIHGSQAELDGVKCKATMNEDVLVLKAKDGTVYEIESGDKDGEITLYKYTTYVYDGEGEPQDLIGTWTSSENWSFEFTDDGTFKEDGYFPGFFIDNKEDHTFSLIYNDHFIDTVCGYTIDGNQLTVRYPWPMVKPVK